MTGKGEEEPQFLTCACDQLPKSCSFAAVGLFCSTQDLNKYPVRSCTCHPPSLGNGNISHLVLDFVPVAQSEFIGLFMVAYSHSHGHVLIHGKMSPTIAGVWTSGWTYQQLWFQSLSVLPWDCLK